jgi:co-chaperonin GroES (HSP10)
LTESGIILTQRVTTGALPGLVLEVGSLVEDIEQGNKVALDWAKGLPVTVEGVKCILVSDEFIRAIY